MKKYKHLIKGAAIIALFMFVLAGVLEALSLTVFSTGKAATYNNQYANAYSYLQEPENSIEIAGIGNSDLYSAIVPAEIWRQAGYTSTLLCAPKQTVRQSNDMLMKLYNVQTPKLVIIETDMLYKHKPKRETDIIDSDETRSLDPFFDAMNPEDFEDIIKGQAPIFMFHNKWKTITKKSKGGVKDLHSHGYHLSVKKKPIVLSQYMVKTDKLDRIKTGEMQGIIDMINFCREKGSEVMLLEVPAPDSWSYERYNAVKKLAEEQKVNFLDMNLYMDEIGIRPSEDFRDLGNHLNYYGAVKASRYLTAYLLEHYELEDLKTNPDYDYWEESVENFDKDVKKELKRYEKRKKNGTD
jgi:hypothetical protein